MKMVEIERYCGYVVEYNALKREFRVWRGNKKILTASTQDEIEDKIDEIVKKEEGKIGGEVTWKACKLLDFKLLGIKGCFW